MPISTRFLHISEHIAVTAYVKEVCGNTENIAFKVTFESGLEALFDDLEGLKLFLHSLTDEVVNSIESEICEVNT